MALNGISASPAAGIDGVLAQLRLAQQRTHAGLGGSAVAAGGAAGAAAAAATPSTILRGRLSLSADDGPGAPGTVGGGSAIGGLGGTGEAAGSGFASALKASLDQVSAAQNTAAQLGQQFEKGVGNVDLNDVMLAMQKANVGFQAAIQVRNRMVSAYQTIMNMQI